MELHIIQLNNWSPATLLMYFISIQPILSSAVYICQTMQADAVFLRIENVNAGDIKSDVNGHLLVGL